MRGERCACWLCGDFEVNEVPQRVRLLRSIFKQKTFKSMIAVYFRLPDSFIVNPSDVYSSSCSIWSNWTTGSIWKPLMQYEDRSYSGASNDDLNSNRIDCLLSHFDFIVLLMTMKQNYTPHISTPFWPHWLKLNCLLASRSIVSLLYALFCNRIRADWNQNKKDLYNLYIPCSFFDLPLQYIWRSVFGIFSIWSAALICIDRGKL